MLRCFALAKLGNGFVAPNPLVGCVIVNKNNIVAEGYHEVFGGPHAEINALNNLKTTNQNEQLTMYINLEPCSHFGKTPPCMHAIVKSGIKKVVIAMLDPNINVHSKGVVFLKDNGIDVTIGVLEKEALELNKHFVTWHKHNKPYIVLKWAECANGFIGLPNKNVQISSAEAQFISHKLRSTLQAIAVGKNTWLTDKPKLSNRLWNGNQPQPWILWGKSKAPVLPANFKVSNSINVTDFVNELVVNNVQSILIEGGARILNAFIEAGFYNEIYIFKSTTTALNNGIKAPIKPMVSYKTSTLSTDTVLHFTA